MIGQRIFDLRIDKEKTQKEVADFLGLTPKMISFYERGERFPPHDIILKLCEYFNVSSDYLLGKTDIHHPSIFKSSAIIRIPVLGTVPAGVPIEAVEDIVDWEEIPSEWTTANREYFALKVKGDSMIPKYIEDDTLIILKSNDCDNGQDAVVLINGFDATLKRVIKKESGIILQPLNPAYEPMIYDKNEVQNIPIKIIGTPIEIRRKI